MSLVEGTVSAFQGAETVSYPPKDFLPTLDKVSANVWFLRPSRVVAAEWLFSEKPNVSVQSVAVRVATHRIPKISMSAGFARTSGVSSHSLAIPITGSGPISAQIGLKAATPFNGKLGTESCSERVPPEEPS